MLDTVTKALVYGAYIVVVCFVGFVLWQALFGPQHSEKHPAKDRAAHSEQQGRDEQFAGAVAGPKPHSPAEQAIADYTRWLAVFTALLVLATVALFVSGERNVEVAGRSADAAKEGAAAAKKSADVARETLIAANRPWIKADIKVASSLTFGEKQARVTFAYILKNVGNAVATHVQVNPKLVPFQFGKVTGERPNLKIEIPQMQPTEELKKLCVGSAESMNNPAAADFEGGHVIFPNDVLSDAVNIHMLNDDIEKARAQSAYRSLIPVLLFCITYRTPFDERTKYTGYAFNLFRRDPTSAGGAREIQPEEGGIPPQDLILMLLPFNSSVAN
jgi:hypothetical protein